MNRENRIKRNGSILSLRREGYSMKDIAERLGTTQGIVSKVCRENGLGGSLARVEEEKRFCKRCGAVFYCDKKKGRTFCSKACQAKDSRQRMKTNEINLTAESEIYAKEMVARISGWEYVDGYTGSDGWVNIRHLECGAVVRKSMVSVRQKLNLKCPECVRRRAEERERALAEEREAKAKERHEKKLAMFSGETMAFKVCVVCGGLFVGGRGNKMCCSSECSRKHSNTMSSRRKDRRITREQMIDRDIDLYKLFMRDKGICHICGGLCDWNDIEARKTGMVAGNMYPSIDHILPIAKGGTHQWSNVKLAHRICNSLKRDKTA